MNYNLIELTKENLERAISFIEQNNEEKSVTLMTHLVDGLWENSLYKYFIVTKDENQNENDEIVAVLMHSKGGLVLHSIKNPSLLLNDENFERVLVKFFENKNLYCIMGEKNANLLLEKIASEVIKTKKILEKREYLLLLYNPENLPKVLKEKKCEYNVVRCSSKNLKDLVELQKNYDIAEVLPKGKVFSKELSKKNLELMLKKQIIFAIKKNCKFVAKAGTNAIGKNFIQLGGVYTDEKYRRKGMAQTLVARVTEEILSRGKKCVLFVRVENTSAKEAYRKVGYTYHADYSITYYSEDFE